MRGRARPVVLIVIDGLGINPRLEGNAVRAARTPCLDGIAAEYPHSALQAHGEAVGLLPGQMGNSNVGHLNLGAGRIVYQDLVRINRSIRSGEFFSNPALVRAAEQARGGRALHLMGLLSDGGVHSHLDHLLALLELAARRGCTEVFVHCFLDGRDVPPACAAKYLEALEAGMAARGVGRVATVMGRYFAMDRDGRWARTERAYRAMVLGEGEAAAGALEALRAAYARDETDEFVAPTVIMDGGRPVGRVSPGDSVVFFNFRADRARQITRAFTEPGFDGFVRPGGLLPLYFVGLTQYDEELRIPYAFAPNLLTNTLGEVVSRAGLRQLRIAETEKYAHVTYFFSGGREEPFEGEDRRLIPSPRVATYDLKPEMSAFEVTDAVLAELRRGTYHLVVLNYANLDMVGHTGVMEAAVRAVEAVDRCLGRVLNAVLALGGAALVVSDHGNAEQMLDLETGQPHTAHTSNPVPCVLVDPARRAAALQSGILAGVAPTLLELLGLKPPPEMEERSLIVDLSAEERGVVH
ncbi:MAG: 2,3-bisphosphoglycerate-independent phosphoglycerate mutase [Acetobacteraceae bacterium]|nr:2,3-bisphosphoglycerate-independent phosphoglycerate mutase [Acetobacteraceae bacterium]